MQSLICKEIASAPGRTLQEVDLQRDMPQRNGRACDACGGDKFQIRTRAEPIAHLVRALAWQGKVFDAERGELANSILLFRINAVRAKVLQEQSWFDGRPCIVLDYSETSLVAPMVRDEIREIEPGLWLGLAYLWRARVLRFALAGDVAAAPDR
jgi:hypothetical protein